MTRTWFITGAGRGLGRAFTEAALGRGDRVVATARSTGELRSILQPHGDRAIVMELDVSHRASVVRVVDEAVLAMGALDVVVNNAGYGLSGGVEEATEAEVRQQFETNFFGALWVTQAALPHMRAKRSGHIIQISSIMGIISPSNLGVYAASKWALEAASEALATEVASFGIKVTLVEPSGFRTDWASSMHRTAPMADYDEVLGSRRAAFDPSRALVRAGDPSRGAQAILELVDSDTPPLRLPLGQKALDVTRKTYAGRLAALDGWEKLALSAESTA